MPTKLLTYICPCEREKALPIRVDYNPEKQDGVKTREVECPYCEDMLTIELPASIDRADRVMRGLKKPED